MLVRFLSRGFHNGSIVEPGDVISVSDDTRLGQHMVHVEGGNDHLQDQPPFAGVFRADLAYVLDPVEVRAQMTEAAIQRAEATRLREAEEERQRVEASTGEQPSTVGGQAELPASPQASDPLPDNPDEGGETADG
jgi:hypothetical protein